MRFAKINILFIFLLDYNARAITLPTFKSLNFVAEETLNLKTIRFSESKSGNNFTLLSMNTKKVIYQNETGQGLILTRPIKQQTKLSFIQKVIKSNLKLSFRLKCNMNLIITYQ